MCFYLILQCCGSIQITLLQFKKTLFSVKKSKRMCACMCARANKAVVWYNQLFAHLLWCNGWTAAMLYSGPWQLDAIRNSLRTLQIQHKVKTKLYKVKSSSSIYNSSDFGATDCVYTWLFPTMSQLWSGMESGRSFYKTPADACRDILFSLGCLLTLYWFTNVIFCCRITRTSEVSQLESILYHCVFYCCDVLSKLRRVKCECTVVLSLTPSLPLFLSARNHLKELHGVTP